MAVEALHADRANGGVRRLWAVWTSYGRDIVAVRISADPVAARALTERLDATTATCRWLAYLSISVSLMLTALFWTEAVRALLVSGTAFVACAVVWTLHICPRRATLATASWLARRHLAVAAVHGLGWTALTTALIPHAAIHTAELAACLQVGMIAIGFVMYVDLPAAFLLFSAPICLPFLAVFAQAHDRTAVAVPLILLLLGILSRAAVERIRLVAQSVRSADDAVTARAAEAQTRIRQQEVEAEERLRAANAAAAATTAAVAARRREMLALAERFETDVLAIIAEQASDNAELAATVRTLVAIAHAASADAQIVAQQTVDSSTSLEALAATAQDLDTGLAAVSARVIEHSGICEAVRVVATEGEQQLRALSQSTTRSGDVTALVGSLTTRTKRLSLNATIEAARAGDAGRGFAVVATEVRLLANQAGTATDEVARQLQGMTGRIDDTVETIGRAKVGIDEVAGIAGAIAGTVVRQQQSTARIGHAVKVVADAVQTVRDRAAQLAAAARSTETVATSLTDTAAKATERSRTLRTASDAFLHGLRADG